MNRTAYAMMFTALLIFNVNAVQAEDALPVIERQVVKVSAILAETVLISIPRAALTSRNGVPGVFVVENDEARFRMVRPGKIGIEQLEILSGLFGNETLILGELELVHDGSPIKISIKKSAVKK